MQCPSCGSTTFLVTPRVTPTIRETHQKDGTIQRAVEDHMDDADDEIECADCCEDFHRRNGAGE